MDFSEAWTEIRKKAMKYLRSGEALPTISRGTKNKIVEVTNEYIRRKSEGDRTGSADKVRKADCEKVWNLLQRNGSVEATELNVLYFTFALINLLDEIEYTLSPLSLHLRLHRRFYVVGSSYGGQSDAGSQNVFQIMLNKGAISVGFLWDHDLNSLVGKPKDDIVSFVDQFRGKIQEYDWKAPRETLPKFLNLHPGDLIAIKSHGRSNHLTIIAYAVVEERNGIIYRHDDEDLPYGLGHLINVRFLETDLKNDTGYTLMRTIHEVDSSNPYFNKIFGTWSQLTISQLEDGEVGNQDNDIDDENISDKDTSTYVRKSSGDQVVTQIHNVIQNKFHRFLKKKFPKDKIKKEYKGMVDIRRENEKEIFYYEVKPFNKSYSCISAAIGQLIEYSHLFPVKKKLKLVIVGQPSLDTESLNYLNYIKSFLQLPIEYLDFKAL